MHLRNHFFRGKKIRNAYSKRERERENVCVWVCALARIALLIQHEKRTRRSILSCGLFRHTSFFNIISLKVQFWGKLLNQKSVFFNFLYKLFLKHFSLREKFSEILSQIYLRIHIKLSLFLSWLMTREFSRHIFEKSFKFHPNSPITTKLLPADRQTDGLTWI